MTRNEMHVRAKKLREELETRHKYGTIKIANQDGTPVPTEKLQEELYSIIYRLSKMDDE
jgi:hypothetical protein